MKAARLAKELAKVRSSEKPTALVGFREWIFSDKAGALGSFAASAEFAFGTIIQRIMDNPAHVRMHYGHPDVFNKIHCMTRVGVTSLVVCASLISHICNMRITVSVIVECREVLLRQRDSSTSRRMSSAVTITR